VIALFTGLLSGWSLLRRHWTDFWEYGLVTIAVVVTVAGIFALSYLTTGLATDLELERSLHFADYARLDAWGVIPQLVAILWLLDNLRAMAPPFGWDVFYQLALNTRLYVIWPFLIGPLFACVVVVLSRQHPSRRTLDRDYAAVASIAAASMVRLGVLVAILALISVIGGQTRSISFERFSTFFVPLLVLLGASVCAWVFREQLSARATAIGRIGLPSALFVGVMASGLVIQHGGEAAYRATHNALLFAIGRYSLAEAYTHTPGYSFGAINPGALAAAHQLPPDTPIWSTNLESYCMAPGCLIESTISFKMSGRLDDILGGDPSLAKKLLQEAGLNYFLFMKDARLRDLLPYSKLFAPGTIGQYLGIKWTDGSTFLLTWSGAGTSPIGPAFLSEYEKRLAEPADPWFLFSKLAPQIVAYSQRLRSSNAPAAANTLPWRNYPIGTVDIIAATYGHNCRTFLTMNIFRANNATQLVREACLGQTQCHFVIDGPRLIDRATQCRKDFSVSYRCSPRGPPRIVDLAAEADGKAVDLRCETR